MNFYLRMNNVDAISPTQTDFGYTLSIISVKEYVSMNTCIFDTGISVYGIDPGYYLEITGNNKLTSLKYELSNSPMIIMESTDNIIVYLTRIILGEDIVLPSDCLNLVVKKIESSVMTIL